MSKFTDFSKYRGGGSGGVSAGWQRPADWLPLPDVTPTDQMFVGLHAVYPDANFCALIAAGNYTVDWGDGTVENYAANARAEHIYDYNNPALDGTECSRGYKQAIVKVYPQDGSDLTLVNLCQKHSQVTLPANIKMSTGYLDIVVAGPKLTSLKISDFSFVASFPSLERARILSAGIITNLSYVLYSCRNLRVAEISDCDSATNFTGLFRDCSSLESVSIDDTSTVSNFADMFSSCHALKTVPYFDTRSGTTFSRMFTDCHSLVSVPEFDTSSGSNFDQMFSNCYSLMAVPAFDTSQGKSFAAMLANCRSILTVPFLDLSSATNIAQMFSNCYTLSAISLMDTSSATNVAQLFSGCWSLRSIPALDFSSATSASNIFNNTWALVWSDVQALAVDHGYVNTYLSPEALNEIYRNLPEVTGRTLTVSSNWGYASSDTAIATAKGWTVN